ncbi:hypothetical protein A1Q2_03110 [Trichosporon asahii var. asahii CBS 8904]|uniref:Uncharacterized protein n=1 Tax=Trichosporon asahii var. asahii (strain CBS 8904) TaxID=1220162 RepID=K1W0Q1_TRIAC|nr:hypothetical protein A1Q2_03110 [Trichosporon asahii var. asahii CBS 8904]
MIPLLSRLLDTQTTAFQAHTRHAPQSELLRGMRGPSIATFADHVLRGGRRERVVKRDRLSTLHVEPLASSDVLEQTLPLPVLICVSASAWLRGTAVFLRWLSDTVAGHTLHARAPA